MRRRRLFRPKAAATVFVFAGLVIPLFVPARLAASGGFAPVDVHVDGHGRFPVTVGIAVPDRASLPPGSEFELRDASGAEVPVQAAPLVVDDEGRLRWFGARFAADCGPGGAKRFRVRLRSGGSPARGSLRIVETDEGVAVNVGGMVVRTSRWEGPLFSLFAGDDAGPALVLDPVECTVGGVSFAAEPAAFRVLSVEAAGPLVARWRVEGAIAAPGGSPRLPYRCRLECVEGWDGVFVRLEFPAPDRPLEPGVDARVRLRPAAGGRAQGRRTETAECETMRFPPAGGGRPCVASRRRRGPADPPAIEESEGAVAFVLVRPERAFGGGRMATLEAFAGYSPRGVGAAAPIPPGPVAGVPGGAVSAGDLPGFPGNPSRKWTPAYEDVLSRTAEAALAESRLPRAPDDFGDWERRPGTFGNLEFDTLDGLVRLGVRRRDPRCLAAAMDSYRHLRDVDLWRSPDGPFDEIRPRLHGRDHGGARFEAGHTFVEGVIALGLVCGDTSILETGLAMAATAAARFVGDEATYRLERNVAWLLHGLAAAAEAAPAENREAFRAAIRATLDDLEKRATAVPGVARTAGDSDEGPGEAGAAEPARDAVTVSTWVAAGILAPALRRAGETAGDDRGAASAEGLARFVARFSRREDARRFALFNRLVADPRSGETLDRSGTVWDENLPLVAAGLRAAAPRDKSALALAEEASRRGAAALAGERRFGGEARSKIWRGLLRSAPD